MTRRNVRWPKVGGVCQRCQHDLLARADGYVYCTNEDCTHHEKPHPTKQKINGREGES